jgi:hypothetical protein
MAADSQVSTTKGDFLRVVISNIEDEGPVHLPILRILCRIFLDSAKPRGVKEQVLLASRRTREQDKLD